MFKPPAPPYVGPCDKQTPGDNKPILRIVLHGTVSPTERGGARDIAAYFRSDAAGGSAHYVVDPGEVVQTAYDSVIAWHAPPNQGSLGVELCDPVTGPLSRWDDLEHVQMLKRTARLVAELCLAYRVPVQMVGPLGLKRGIRGICEHSDVSEAFKQSTHWDLGAFPRRRFLRMVQAEVAALKEVELDEPQPPAKPAFTRVTRARDLLEAAYRRSRKAIRKRSIEKAIAQLPER